MTPHIDKKALNEKLELINNSLKPLDEAKNHEPNLTLHNGIVNYFTVKGFKHRGRPNKDSTYVDLGYGSIDVTIIAKNTSQTVAIYFKDNLTAETTRRMIGNWEFPADSSLQRVKSGFKAQLAHIVKKYEDNAKTIKQLNK